MIVVTMRAL